MIFLPPAGAVAADSDAADTPGSAAHIAAERQLPAPGPAVVRADAPQRPAAQPAQQRLALR